LPFRPGRFALAVALNLLDAVPDPAGLLQSLAAAVAPGGAVLVACPYDWSAQVTTPGAWLGGHSQRSEHRGDPAAVLRLLLTPEAHPASVAGLRLLAERDDLPWQVRLHDRSVMQYRLHAAVAVREA
jgi:SAM-dependent methyltransferase